MPLLEEEGFDLGRNRHNSTSVVAYLGIYLLDLRTL